MPSVRTTPRSSRACALVLAIAFATSSAAAGNGAAAPATHGASHATADLILTNGVVRTQAVGQPTARAVAVSAGAIVYVGSNDGALAWRGPRTELIDLHGMTLLPGLADTHVHPALGEFLNHRLCDVHAYSVEEGFAKLRHCADGAPAGDWVVGYGWYDLDNAAFDSITRAQLDALVPDRKLAVFSKDIHTLWVNSKTLLEFGIGRDTPSPAGGEIVHDAATGEPTGMLIDAANRAVAERVQHDSPYAQSTAEICRSAMTHLNSLGITSILDAFADDDAARVYRTLDLAGQLTMRVSLAMPVLPSNYRTEIPRIAANRATWRSPHVRVDFVKVIADGNPEVGLSSLVNHDGRPETATPGYYTPAQMVELVALAERAGLSVFVHVIGDGAAREVLDAVSAARVATPLTKRRHTLTHLVWVADSDLPRFRILGVIANIQEGWLAPAAFGGPPGYDYARSTAAGPIGPWLAGRLLPYRPLKEAGARLAGGSDWFYTEENPWRAMESGVTSKDPGRASGPAMLPNHALDLPTLIRARTVDAAYQLYLEDRTGSIAPGKRADLVVVDQDPLQVPIEQLHRTAVEFTLFDGHVVYRRASGTFPAD
jgi:predicted amidohydrolase YtcJ